MKMTLPAYVTPPTSITWVSGNLLPPQYLCTLPDAQIVARETGGVLANGVDFFKSFGIHFIGLLASDSLQPYVITLNGSTNFVGPSVVEMYAANEVNGGGVGNQGSFQQISGQWKWVPVAPAVVVAPIDNSGSLAGFLAAMNLTSSGISVVDQEILNLLIQIKTKLGA